MPQHPGSRRPRGRPSPHRRVAVTTEPVAPARALVQSAVITATAFDAANDLATAAASVHRLGQLTSGMWRALGRELATAAERLDRQVEARLDDLERRAHALQVDPQAALTAGIAAGHLEEHRPTLETLLPRRG
jgi:C4-dicarboxylate-specific signal transduction histidine kinase